MLGSYIAIATIPTDMCRDVPSIAYTMTGTKEEYNPYTTGSSASKANPIPIIKYNIS